LAVLRFYRQGISPLLQPACRYQPTCSRYAIAAYRQQGGWRGTVLTTWRLMRCAPWGKGGYDPVRWPPVGLEAVFGASDAVAPVAVVLGAAGFVKLVHALLFE
jgi:putative membrane protein insertion efficiency factor